MTSERQIQPKTQVLGYDNAALGRFLVAQKRLKPGQLAEAEALARQWNVGLVQVLLSRRWIDCEILFSDIARHSGLPTVDLQAEPPDMDLLKRYDSVALSKSQTIPIRRDGGRVTVATARLDPASILETRRTYGAGVEICVATPEQITGALQRAFRQEHSHKAVYALAELDPEMSAQRVFTTPQMVVFYLALSVFLAGLALAPVATLVTLNFVLMSFYLGNFLFKALLVWVGGEAQETSSSAIAAEQKQLRDDALPVFTVLVPMFKEPEVLPILTNALRRLDYPLAKLDIKLVLEETDHETIDAALALDLEGVFEILRVPQSHPQTKPKACNYALNYARGDFLVIYDAEDKPEPDQLKKVIAAFRAMPADTACIQCRLNYYNARENWLTRMFTLDYSLWFDLMLPGLERLGVPIPLGGTSNHFRMSVLRELNAWDPFNVTEDADLGIRLTQKGYRVGVIDSTTYEEANVSVGNWIRQRSRWVKGYMQTFLVHTRRPIHLLRTIGPLGFLGFVAFVGGTVLTGLLNPIFWATFCLWMVIGSDAMLPYFPPVILHLSLLSLLAGNGLLIYLTMVAPFRRRWADLAPWGISAVGYWVLMTIASYKALGQLFFNPFYWEKTQHGLSKHTAAEIAEATVQEAS